MRTQRGSVVRVFGNIDWESTKVVCREIEVLARCRSQLEMWIDSAGGDLISGLTIYCVMQLTEVKVKTVCCGRAYSAASLLLAAGSRGCRSCVASSSVMMHWPVGTVCGGVSDIVYQLACAIDFEDEVVKAYMKHCDKSWWEVRHALSASLTMRPTAAVAWGITDRKF
ncbi:MAG: ATP-dependent Clp protease proteolytic subunit [Candidatus Hodgkinia cicadicola]